MREKLEGHHFKNLGALAQRVSVLSNQWQYQCNNTRFQKTASVADYYNSLIDKDFEVEEEDENVEWNWSNKQIVINHPWGKTQEAYDFDIFEAKFFLLSI